MALLEIKDGKVKAAVFVATALFLCMVAVVSAPLRIPHKLFLPVGLLCVASLWLTPWEITLALLFGLALKLLLTFAPHDFLLGSPVGKYFLEMFQIGIIANFSLAFVNLVPLPPLDGGHILEGLLPRSLANAYAGIGRYGFLILVVLLASGMLSSVLTPLLRWSWNTTLTIYGL